MAVTATNKATYLDSSRGWYSWTVDTVDKSSEKMQGFLYSPPVLSCLYSSCPFLVSNQKLPHDAKEKAAPFLVI